MGGDQWGGIVFDAGSTGLVQNAEFRYGGGETEAMVQIDQAWVTIENTKFLRSGEDGVRIHNITDPQQVRILHCAFADNQYDGIECNDASPTITAASFSGNGRTAIRLTGTSFPNFQGDLTAATDGIHLIGSTLKSSGHWEYAGIPYILDGDIVVPTNIVLTIDPQVVIKGAGYWNSIIVQGQLIVAGETGRPVYLTALADDTIAGDTNDDTTNSVPKGDQWGGIIFEAGSTGLVQNAEFRYGGGETEAMVQIDQAWVTIENTKFLRSGEDAVRIHNITDPQQVRILHCDFTDNQNDGIQCDDASPTIQACHFAGNAHGGIWLTGTSFPEFSGDLTADREGIWVNGATLTRSGTYQYAGIPYILAGDLTVPKSYRLEIQPGVIFKGNSYWNSIIVEGQLAAVGTADRPIWFTSYQWYKGTNLILDVNRAAWEIPAAEMGDAGDYRVRVKNEVGEASSQTAGVTVVPGGPVTEPIRFTSIKVVQGRIELRWVGGQAPFAILSKPGLADANWQSAMETNERAVSMSKRDGSLFFLIQQK